MILASIYVIISGFLTFYFCVTKGRLDECASGTDYVACILCGVFWIVAGVPYFAYLTAIFYKERGHLPWQPMKPPKGKKVQLFQPKEKVKVIHVYGENGFYRNRIVTIQDVVIKGKTLYYIIEDEPLIHWAHEQFQSLR